MILIAQSRIDALLRWPLCSEALPSPSQAEYRRATIEARCKYETLLTDFGQISKQLSNTEAQLQASQQRLRQTEAESMKSARDQPEIGHVSGATG